MQHIYVSGFFHLRNTCWYDIWLFLGILTYVLDRLKLKIAASGIGKCHTRPNLLNTVVHRWNSLRFCFFTILGSFFKNVFSERFNKQKRTSFSTCVTPKWVFFLFGSYTYSIQMIINLFVSDINGPITHCQSLCVPWM